MSIRETHNPSAQQTESGSFVKDRAVANDMFEARKPIGSTYGPVKLNQTKANKVVSIAGQ